MNVYAFFAVGVGSALGAWLRWGLSEKFNDLIPELPLGTLAANLIGGYLVGLAIAYFSNHVSLPQEWRLLIITGFLGGLTTFSTFSAEAISLLSRAQYGWAALLISGHLIGSLIMTALGVLTLKP